MGAGLFSNNHRTIRQVSHISCCKIQIKSGNPVKSAATLCTKDSGREGPACRVISCRMERGMNYCVYAHLRQLIAISRHFWSVLKRSRHAASESHADMTDAAEFNMIVSEFLTRQKAKTKQPSGPLVKTCNLGPNSLIWQFFYWRLPLYDFLAKF